ncbi:type II secretion system assembly factor GspB [Dickeya fangzhongdai]|uniref:General secretion pathway protein GspB n=1 Tax=Dickeya fangzhongdai TaxID=1778540 RepID=A0A2K8QP91_9GAMM|nr:type II secretion system assembly factor GspB [Dickeya fangzhongdai]ATZ95212.1 general secretion pathway protein GspB [Dickeya fangzhongdai]QOH48653.1 general secretion pathway protein GspB [Dickeya fangzhongdai]QOH52957.1 general secretion pathway protein GspB [Dickeya fangzhongdai]UMB75551.1 type II secretion system assembly factor GspB [Dickeya fangzhongdai]WES88982.1 type II secretion system assembly factor GspB [Dickeya fangzhongdai]
MKKTPEVTSSIQTGYRIPGYLLVVYALLLFALGWFGHQRWADVSPPSLSVPTAAIAAPPIKIVAPATATVAEATPPPQAATDNRETATSPDAAAEDKPLKSAVGWQTAKPGELPYIAFSAHVYTSDPDKRSVTLNGERYREGDSPYQGLVIEQIEQDMVIFSFNGEAFILDSLQDWPGGKPGADAAQVNDPEPTSKPEKTVRTTKK